MPEANDSGKAEVKCRYLLFACNGYVRAFKPPARTQIMLFIIIFIIATGAMRCKTVFLM